MSTQKFDTSDMTPLSAAPAAFLLLLLLPDAIRPFTTALLAVQRSRCITCRSTKHARHQHYRSATAMLAATASTDTPSTTIDTTAFKAWLVKNGVKGGDCLLEVGASPLDGGRGLITTTSIKSGQPALTVPLTLCITAASTLKGPLGKALADYDGCLGDTGIMALQLLYERHRGEASPLFAWLSLLPQSLELPLFWSEDELAVADGSSTRGFSGLKEDVADDHAWLSANVFSESPPFPADAFTLDAFAWAVGCILSRSFFVEGALHLAPLVDFANHGDEPTAAVNTPPPSADDSDTTAANGQGTGGNSAREQAAATMKNLFDNLNTIVDVDDGAAGKAAAQQRAQLAREPQSCGLGVFGGKGIRLLAGRDYAAGEEVSVLLLAHYCDFHCHHQAAHA